MPLPIKRSDFDKDWQFHGAVHDLIFKKAKRRSGNEWDWDAWESVLTPLEFDFLLLGYFDGVWNTNGRFVDTVKCWEHEFDRVGRMFRRLGFRVAAKLVPRALELEALQLPYLRRDIPMPRRLAAEIKRVNEAASKNVSEKRMTRILTERSDEFDFRTKRVPKGKST